MRRSVVDWNTGCGLAAIALWSTTFAFARSLSEQVGPITGGAVVYLLGGGYGLLRVSFSAEGWDGWRQLPRNYLLGCGGLFVFYTAALYAAIGLAQSREQLLEIALLNYLWPALTVLCSLALLGHRASLGLAPGTALALTGLVLVFTRDGHLSWAGFLAHVLGNPAAYGLALTAALAWALYSNLTRRWAGSVNSGAVNLFLLATGLVLLGMRFLTVEQANWSLRAIAEAVALATVTTVAYGLWDLSMRRGNLRLVVACSYFTPLLSTLVSCLYLRVSPGWPLWIGCLMLVIGSLLTWVSVSDAPAGEKNGSTAEVIPSTAQTER